MVMTTREEEQALAFLDVLREARRAHSIDDTVAAHNISAIRQWAVEADENRGTILMGDAAIAWAGWLTIEHLLTFGRPTKDELP